MQARDFWERKLQFRAVTTDRFCLDILEARHVDERYRAWFLDPVAQRFIIAASGEQPCLGALREYVDRKRSDPAVIFYGIWHRASGELIGTVKFEPVDVALGSATCGIFIGEPSWRGRGVAAEVLKGSMNELYHAMRISKFFMGVDPENTAAISAYRKIGFCETSISVASKPGHLSFLFDIESSLD